MDIAEQIKNKNNENLETFKVIIQELTEDITERKTQLDNTQQEIQSLTTDRDYNQQVLEESMTALDANQRLTSSCDNIQNNISNIQISLKRLDKLSLLKNKLIALETDWSALMNIVNEFMSL
ncbi:MAG: hypothetical protein WA659_03750 [Candidatus Aquirickettsiella sp.]